MTVLEKQDSVRRILDPVHNLITFNTNDDLECALWRIVKSEPFQRLRRKKQLGFSELVYPGATHTRFAHSIGVFHTARQLMEVVRRDKLVARDTCRENIALAAALVHDVGHGPFSHAFEAVGKSLKLDFADHETMSDMLIRDSELSEILNGFDDDFANHVADMIKKKDKKTVHNAVVSSQFDADRLDYMRRDSMMTGVQHSVVELEWLLANLEIGNVQIAEDNNSVAKIRTFVMGPKAIQAAEAYVLNLFHLYQTVYFHKTTRGAERLFVELLVRVVELVQDGSFEKTGLPKAHPLVKFAENPDVIETVQTLDDFVIWGALALLKDSTDRLLSEFSSRLLNRKLFKCIDIRAKVTHEIDPDNVGRIQDVQDIKTCCKLIADKLKEWSNKQKTGGKKIPRLLVDVASRLPYETAEDTEDSTKTEDSTQQIYISTDGGRNVDLNERSEVVKALQPFRLTRVYHRQDDAGAKTKIETIINGEVKKWQRSRNHQKSE